MEALVAILVRYLHLLSGEEVNLKATASYVFNLGHICVPKDLGDRTGDVNLWISNFFKDAQN